VAESQAGALKAGYELARLQVEDTRLEAPVSGSVAEILVDEGNLVDKTVPLLVLVQDDPIRANIPLPEKYYGLISAGKGFIPVLVSPEAYPQKEPFRGRIGSVSPTINPRSRTFTVEVEIDNPARALRQGMYVSAQFILERAAAALLVPSEASAMKSLSALFLLIPLTLQGWNLSFEEAWARALSRADSLKLERTAVSKSAATLKQPLFSWGKLNSAVSIASLDLELASLSLEKRKKEVHRELRRLCFSTLLYETSTGMLERTAAALEEILADRKISFQAGEANLHSVLEAEARLAAVRTKLEEARQGALSAREGLGVLTGLDVSPAELTTGFPGKLPPLEEQALKERSLLSSEDLKRLRLELKKAEANLIRARGAAALHPDIRLEITLSLAGQSVPFTKTSWDENWRSNLTVSLGAQGTLLTREQLDSARLLSLEKELERQTGFFRYAETLAELELLDPGVSP